MATPLSLTDQLRRFSSGQQEVAEVVLREILPKLHEIAVRELHRERYIAPLSPTELINEVWLRSLGKGGWNIESREHFYAIASLAMRRVLVDFARHRLAQRRGDGDVPESLDEHPSMERSLGPDPETVVHIGLLMEKLEKADPEAARVVDMHYFAGFTLEEIAKLTGLTFRQVRHRWEKGRDWLKDRMGD
ncbi:MAG: ECF-type sigma factor [Terriglobia bacterium]|jgi:RNA polymerase sigma factor (TIGR02999 family)